MTEPDDRRLLIKTLAFYLHRGYPLEIHEPPIRGRKGPARDRPRTIGITVIDARAFDAIRWELIKRMLRRR